MTIHSGWSDPPIEHVPDMTLIERYWFRETSPEETAALEVWFAAHPEWKARYDRLQQDLKTDPCVDLSVDELQHFIANVLYSIQDGSEAKVAAQIGVEVAEAKPLTERVDTHIPTVLDRCRNVIPAISRSGLSARRTMAVAVSLFLVLAVGFSWLLTDIGRDGIHSDSIYTAGIGQRITVTLADGSRVTLAPQTTVLVSPTFSKSTRTVSLIGEAHFDVVAGHRQPFIVQTGTVKTRVLGTRFVVKHYRNDRFVHVAVETGKVSVGSAVSLHSVVAAGRVAWLVDSGVVISTGSNLSDYTDWMNGQITFNGTPLPEALVTLHRWYGVKFMVADSSLAALQLSGTIPHGSLEDLLRNLKDLLDVSLSDERHRDGSLTITLHPIPKERSAHLRSDPSSRHPTSADQ